MTMPSNEGRQPRRSNRRRSGRLRQEMMRTNYGPVLDLSGTGMRIVTRYPLFGRVVLVKLQTLHGSILTQCEVIWKRRVGLLKKEVGLRFINLDPGIIQQFTSVRREGVLAELAQ